MPENGSETDDFFAEASVKNAPRHFPNAFRVLAGLTAGLFIGGGIWGTVQVASALTNNDVSSVAPTALQQAEANYYSTNDRYTDDISQLKDGSGKPLSLPTGVSATVIGLCDDGWLAKVSSALGADVRYVSATNDSDGADVGQKLSDVTLPSCVTVDSLRKSGVAIQASDNSVKVSNVKIQRSKSVGDDYSGSREGARIAWDAKATCRADMKAQYQITVQQQKPEGVDIKVPGDDFDLRTFDSAKKAINVDMISNGGTYEVKVYGSCSSEFTSVAPVTATYSASLPPARVRVSYDTLANANGGVFPIVNASSSKYVSYDIQYRKGYASGWTTLIRDYVSGGPVTKAGYYASYGDEFRARAVSFDGKQVGEWGPATTLRYTGF